MASLDMFKSIRSAYQSKEGFDEHTTKRHSVSDALADQCKGAWFCIKEGLLRPKDNSIEAPDCYPLDNSGKPRGKVANCFIKLMLKKRGTRKLMTTLRLSYMNRFLTCVSSF